MPPQSCRFIPCNRISEAQWFAGATIQTARRDDMTVSSGAKIPDDFNKWSERSFRLWAASGQAVLESSKVLVISASATSTSILKNLVLPGIGHFTIIDDKVVTPEDAGNNFFFNGHHSIGKSRAEEAVACLRELNDGVEGISDTSNFERRFNSDPSFLAAYTIIIAHNLHPTLLDKVAEFLWTDSSLPTLIVVRSAGFFAEFFIQFHEHHSEP